MRHVAAFSSCAVGVLTFCSVCLAQSQPPRAALPQTNALGAAPPMLVNPPCPVVFDPDKSTKQLTITYFPFSRAATIKNPRSLTLRLDFNAGFYTDHSRTIPFERQPDGSWQASVPLTPVNQWNYAIWYVRDDTTHERDDNHGQYWDLVFCGYNEKKLARGVLNQAMGYEGEIFSDDIKRPSDYSRALAILQANIDPKDDQSSLLVSVLWSRKSRPHGAAAPESASPAFVQEIQKTLSDHSGEVAYVEGTTSFLVSNEKAFPPEVVAQAVALADRINHRRNWESRLDRQRAEDVTDPHARAQALADWLAKYPDDPDADHVRKERLETFVYRLADVAGAESAFQDAVKRTPDDADLYTAMATVYLRRRTKLDQALALLNDAEQRLETQAKEAGSSGFIIFIAGQRALINELRGEAFLDQQDWAQAETCLQEAAPAIKYPNQAATTYDLLGNVQERQWEWDKAKNSYLQAALLSQGWRVFVDKFVEVSLLTGTPTRDAALQELAGAKHANFDAVHYKPALLDQPLPDFTFTTAAGEKITPASLRGKTVVLDLWASWCGPCISELGGFAKFQQLHPDVTVLLAAMDSTEPAIEKDFQTSGLASQKIVLIDKQNFAKFGTNGIPQTYVIDKSGRIRIIHYGALSDVPLFLNADLAAISAATP